LKDTRWELQRAINTFQSSSEYARQVGGGEMSHVDTFGPARSKVAITQYFPLGVVLCVTPFNFPINM
jgi:acyl-CoA reductase-like NAD-dependent aldehyde dehydrogenase